jgi:hypothetical protein
MKRWKITKEAEELYERFVITVDKGQEPVRSISSWWLE